MRTIIVAALDSSGSHNKAEFYRTLLPLADWEIETNTTLQLYRLPCIFKQSLLELEKLITQHKPSHLLLVAQNPENKQVSVEKVALNVNDALQPDDNNQQPRDTLTAQHGPAAYFSNLPVAAITSALKHSAVPARLSYTAGTYVANHVFYGLMHYIKHQNTNLQGGLLQFPLLPQQACLEQDATSISPHLLLDAVKLVVKVCLSHSDQMLRDAG